MRDTFQRNNHTVVYELALKKTLVFACRIVGIASGGRKIDERQVAIRGNKNTLRHGYYCTTQVSFGNNLVRMRRLNIPASLLYVTPLSGRTGERSGCTAGQQSAVR